MAQNVVVEPEREKEIEQLQEKPSRLPPGRVAPWQGEMIEVHLAPGRESRAAPAVHKAPRRRRRKVRVDWYGLGVILLMLSAAVVAVIRLLGAAPH